MVGKSGAVGYGVKLAEGLSNERAGAPGRSL
jgi:hypothetical protein